MVILLGLGVLVVVTAAGVVWVVVNVASDVVNEVGKVVTR
jgi:hypothetical protein